jgi:hypothetical protein
MSLAADTRLGPYEILAALGAGGMDEVCRTPMGASQISPLCNIEHRRCTCPTYASRQRMALLTFSLDGPDRDNRTGIHTFQATCL